MSLDRNDMLRELELLPVWQRRLAPATATDIATDTAPQAAALPETDAPASAAEATSAPVMLPQSTAGIETPMLAPISESRVGQIAEMDWQALQACVQTCEACDLAQGRTQTVFGVGDPDADWLIVGEAPGAEEDLKGEPFVGQSGKLLDNMLAAIKLVRGKNVYIANTVKCRPPENRNPQAQELQQCGSFLQRQVALMQPKLILVLGEVAAQALLGRDDSIANLRGKLHSHEGVPVIVTYHPAYLLRNPADKARAWEDLCFARRTMEALVSGIQATTSI
jgi:uracil-DNA glycosylase family 4